MPSTIRRMLEMIRFSHTLFALPFALLAAVLAWAAPTGPAGEGPRVGFQPLTLLGVVLCMVFARSAAMAFNRLVDRELDAANPRTAGRHLPSGQLSVSAVRWFTIVNCLLFVATTLLFWPNWLPLALSLPVLGFLLAYSYMKRVTALAHFWLGASLMLAPVAAWIAIRGAEVLQRPADLLAPSVLGAAVLAWVAGFDIIYACQDREHDAEAGLHSVPAALGVSGALRLAASCHLVMAALLAALPWLAPTLGLGWPYAGAVAAVAALLCYEHWLVRPDDLTRVNVAFAQVNMVISMLLLAAGAVDMWW